MAREILASNLLVSVPLILWSAFIVNAFTPPSSKCYAVDRNNYLYDFTDWIGKLYEYNGKGSDFSLRFCNDVENRSDAGYVDYGRFSPDSIFVAGSGEVDFVQEYRYGDLKNCEHNGYNKMGRDAQINILCGSCSGETSCTGDHGCICNVTYDPSLCRAVAMFAISCGPRGPHVFPGFTVGFNPRGWEVVYNGITQWGFYKPFLDYRIETDQTIVSLYFTAISALSKLVGKPVFQVYPGKGLSVWLSGTAGNGDPPTTESPTILEVNWQCNIARELPYEVNITVPVEGYDPIVFFLSKMCAYKQVIRRTSSRGWANFGVLSCIVIVLGTAFCCAGFCYKTRVEHKHGLEALPGVGIVARCLDMTSGAENAYSPVDGVSDVIANQSTWDRGAVPIRVQSRTADTKYGSM
eukprot:c23845_g1_i1 orf=393-1616(+)